MTWLGWVASISLTVSMLFVVLAVLSLLNVRPSRGIVTWRGKPYNPKEDE